MKKSTLSILALIIAILALLITSISSFAQTNLSYNYRETYKNNVRSRSVDTVKIEIDEVQKRAVITEQVNGKVSVNCFSIVAPVLDNSIASQWTLRILSLTPHSEEPYSFLFLDKTNNVITYSSGYITYIFDNDSSKSLKSRKLKVAKKRKKTSTEHYSFLNL